MNPTMFVLIVDDVPYQLNWLKGRVIERLGTRDCKIVEAATEQEAYRLIEQNDTISIAIVDVYLQPDDPNRGGLRVCAQLRQKFGDQCYCIAVSGTMAGAEYLRGNEPIDRFVYLRSKANYNPAGAFLDALEAAVRHHESLVQHV